jgi:polyisoprenoid-binding protein YceI
MTPLAGTLEVLTFKDGLLSKVAHDLLVRAERFDLRTDGARVEGSFELDSLVVSGVMRDGELDSHGLSEGDRHDIRANMQKKVLEVAKYPRATFSGSVTGGDGRHQVNGTLTLHGMSQDVSVEVREADGRWVGQAELVPSRWGIKPYKALLGAIKLRDRVVVRFEFPVVAL